MKLYVYLAVSILVFCTSARADAPPPKTYEQINSNVTPANIKFFEDHLAKCPEHEVRCVWFSGDHIKVGMLMTFNLQNATVDTVREVYDWASQNAKTPTLSQTQVARAKALLITLPPGAEKIPFGKGIHLAFWREGKPQTVTYDRMAAPLILQQLYDIGGGYLDCKYSK